MTLDRKKAFIINVVFAVLLIALVYILLKYMCIWLLPFIIGITIAMLLKPLILGISKMTKLSQKAVAIVVVLLTYTLLGVFIYFLGGIIISQSVALFKQLPEFYTSSLSPLIKEISNKIYELPGSFDGETRESMVDFLNMLSKNLDTLVSSSSGVAMEFLGKLALKVPSVIVCLIFTVVASFFISTDYPRVMNFLLLQLSEKHQEWVLQIKSTLLHTMAKLLYAYFLLFIITFAELTIGLSLLKIDYAVTIAALIAFADFLPVIGTGAIVVPWVVFEFLQGNYPLALGLFALYGIIVIIRNIIEPKIVGKQIGLHPLITLITMYIGLRFFGFLGLILLPFLLIIIKYMNDNDIIHLWKEPKANKANNI